MKIGLYFGSFNPIHTGHLIIASHVINTTSIDQVWFVVSPQNPFKNSASLLNERHRFNLVELAIEGENQLKASNVEFKLPKPSYTIDTLTYLGDKFPSHKFSIIMGSDGFQNILKWKNALILMQRYPILIYNRPGFDISETYGADITILQAPMLEISGTHIRKLIRTGKSIRYLVTDVVKEEIEKNKYYGNTLENPA